MKSRQIATTLLFLLAAGLIYWAYTYAPVADWNWALVSLLLLLLGLGLFYLRYERARVSSKELAVIASLAAFAIVGRLLFLPFPNFKPTTYFVLLAGYVFGSRAGFMVGATAALVSNMFFGQGPWTPWQMAAWGLAGACSGLFGRWRGARISSVEMAAFGAVWGFLFGWIMNTWTWLSAYHPLNLTTFLLANLSSFWFDLTHAVSNVVFAMLLTRSFLPILFRFRKKLTITTLEVHPHEQTQPLVQEPPS